MKLQVCGDFSRARRSHNRWGRAEVLGNKNEKSYKYRIIQKTLKSTRLYKYMDLSYYIKCYKAQFWTIL